ncbi:hypothetical protein KKE26_04370 [bacterium]|nr:hypothetical protein [bacterium]MBU1753505.1 hypothetical protein [bacterium]
MEKSGYIEIKIIGSKGKMELTPDNYDIKEIITLLQNVEGMLFPGEKRQRPTISYRIEDGSVRHLLKTSLQVIIGLNAILFQINDKQNIDFLEYQTAKAFETFQDSAKRNDYEFNITTSIENTNKVTINKNTQFYRTESIWVDAEFYFYGKITDMGGKDKANFHIATENMGTILIQTSKDFLVKYESNPLYKDYGIRAVGKQNVETGEMDKHSLRFKEIIDYDPVYDEQYLKNLRQKAQKSWQDIGDPDKWLREIRGGYIA